MNNKENDRTFCITYGFCSDFNRETARCPGGRYDIIRFLHPRLKGKHLFPFPSS
jgi:hypothetical protein